MSRALVFVLLLVAGNAAATPRAPLTLTFLGVAGWSISDGKHVILVDPYFSRPAQLEGARPDAAAIAAHAPPRADLILVGHGHVDHALDAPSLARRTGAPIMGSANVAAQARAAGLPEERILLVKGGEDYQLDGFSVRVIPSLHSVIGKGGDEQTFAYLLRLGGQEILVFDTANYIERELQGLHPDVAIVAPGLREKIRDYSCRLMRALGQPRLVLATHFDAWREPPETPLSDEDRADLRAFAAEIAACAPRTKVIVPRPFVPLIAR